MKECKNVVFTGDRLKRRNKLSKKIFKIDAILYLKPAKTRRYIHLYIYVYLYEYMCIFKTICNSSSTYVLNYNTEC